MRVRFGINFMPTASAPEVVRWARLVEDLGYELLGISDSQSICRDVYMTLSYRALMGAPGRVAAKSNSLPVRA